MADINLKQLAVIVVLIVSMAGSVIIGGAILGGMSKTVRDSTVVAITDFNVSVVGTPASLAAYEYPQTLKGCIVADNASDTVPYAIGSTVATSVYTITEGFTETDGLFNLVTGTYNNSKINCTTLTYLEDSNASGAADLFGVALIIFGTFVGIISLSIVGKSILSIFQKE